MLLICTLFSRVPPRLLYGRNGAATKGGLVLAGLLFVLSYLFWRLPGVSEAAYDLLPVDVIGGGIVVLLLLAAAHAYLNDGLIVSWLLVFGSLLGATLNRVGVGLTSSDPLAVLALSAGLPLGGAVIIGTSGHLVGVGLRMLIRAAAVD